MGLVDMFVGNTIQKLKSVAIVTGLLSYFIHQVGLMSRRSIFLGMTAVLVRVKDAATKVAAKKLTDCGFFGLVGKVFGFGITIDICQQEKKTV